MRGVQGTAEQGPQGEEREWRKEPLRSDGDPRVAGNVFSQVEGWNRRDGGGGGRRVAPAGATPPEPGSR